MPNFIRGWRRKLGCTTLTMALLLAGPWTRSYQLRDRFEFWIGPRQHVLYSFEGKIIWDAVTPDLTTGKWSWNSRAIRDASAVSEPQMPWDPTDHWTARRWNLQYGPFVLPLALWSAYLILWRPSRPSKPMTATDHE